jgi:hypothetical protein
MNALLFSRRMSLAQLPPVINIPPELDEAMREFTTKGLQQNPKAEANAVICHDGSKFYLVNMAFGSKDASSTDHKGVAGVGTYHSHPENSRIDVGDFMKMLEKDRRNENFSLVDGSGERRSALFKTVDSPTMFTSDIQKAQESYKKKHAYDSADQIVEVARCAFMGYYEGRGRILYRVYPRS